MVSEYTMKTFLGKEVRSLNPCSCGRWSQREILEKFRKDNEVLILVLVEDGLRVKSTLAVQHIHLCLNPCSCGRWSQRKSEIFRKTLEECLNPCSCGRWSQRHHQQDLTTIKQVVLILVLVEDGLRAIRSGSADFGAAEVLILVLVEDGLRVNKWMLFLIVFCLVLILVLVEDGLRGLAKNILKAKLTTVLILVLVEDGLRVADFSAIEARVICLNPCSGQGENPVYYA